MELILLDASKKNDYNTWLKYFSLVNKHDIFVHPFYLLLFSKYEKNSIPNCMIYRDKEEILMFPFLKKKIIDLGLNTISNKVYYDIFSPYGYGGYLTNSARKKEIVCDFQNNFRKYCIKENIVCEFLRFNLFDDVLVENYDGIVEKNRLNVYVDLTKDEVHIKKNYEHKVRKNINKALRHSLKFHTSFSYDDLSSFVEIYISTMKRKNANKEYYFDRNFFLSFNNDLNDFCRFFYVSYNGKIISSELVLFSNENMYSFLGGTLEEYYNLRPNDFLKHKIICWGRENGFKRFVLGGGYQPNDGIYKYKKAFNPNGVIPFYIGKKIFKNDLYSELCVAKIKKDNLNKIEFYKKGYFPLYRG